MSKPGVWEMTEYDQFADSYQQWAVTATAYSVVETYTFF